MLLLFYFSMSNSKPSLPAPHFFETWLSASAIGNPLLDAFGSITFHERIGQKEDWPHWCNTVFTPLFAPHFLEIHHLAGRHHFTEIRALDRKLEKALPREIREKSISAGSKFCRALKAPASERGLQKYQQAVLAEEHAGHYLTIMAARCSLFGITAAQSLGCYLYQELKQGSRLKDEEILLSRLEESWHLVRPAWQTKIQLFAA